MRKAAQADSVPRRGFSIASYGLNLVARTVQPDQNESEDGKMNLVPAFRKVHFRLRWLCCLLSNTDGQDLIEYALMAAAVAIGAGAFIPPMGDAINVIFSKVVSLAARVPS